jgi:hypothetical protein
MVGLTVVSKAGFARVNGQIYGTAAAAVATVGAAARDVRLTPESCRTVAAVPAWA